MNKLKVVPLVSINGIKFGCNREIVRKNLGPAKEFKKSLFSENTTDDFGYCHVYYDSKDRFEAIEIFADTMIEVNDRIISSKELEKIVEEIGPFEEEFGSWVNKNLSIGLYAPNGNVEAVLFGRRDYYM